MTAKETDRLKLSLERFIAATINTDFLSLYPGKVIAPGSAAGLFDFQPDNARMPGLQDVQLRTGIPGVTVSVLPADAECLLGFEGGRPDAPFLALFSGGGSIALKLSAAATIRLDAPVVALGPAWQAFIAALAADATAPGTQAAATALQTLLQTVPQ